MTAVGGTMAADVTRHARTVTSGRARTVRMARTTVRTARIVRTATGGRTAIAAMGTAMPTRTTTATTAVTTTTATTTITTTMGTTRRTTGALPASWSFRRSVSTGPCWASASVDATGGCGWASSAPSGVRAHPGPPPPAGPVFATWRREDGTSGREAEPSTS